jgi:hypothetical protein
MTGRKLLKYSFAVVVTDDHDPQNGHLTIEWLSDRGLRPDRDYDLDMHGGRLGYTSFWFKRRVDAMATALTWT